MGLVVGLETSIIWGWREEEMVHLVVAPICLSFLVHTPPKPLNVSCLQTSALEAADHRLQGIALLCTCIVCFCMILCLLHN